VRDGPLLIGWRLATASTQAQHPFWFHYRICDPHAHACGYFGREPYRLSSISSQNNGTFGWVRPSELESASSPGSWADSLSGFTLRRWEIEDTIGSDFLTRGMVSSINSLPYFKLHLLVRSYGLMTPRSVPSRPTKGTGYEDFLSARRTNPVRKKLHTSAKLPETIAIREKSGM
jgi:hypothetical protein